jgi:hypothetical protein
MIKEAINSVQDVMGFRSAVRTGFAYHMLRSEEEIERKGPADFSENKQMSRVGGSLRGMEPTT